MIIILSYLHLLQPLTPLNVQRPFSKSTVKEREGSRVIKNSHLSLFLWQKVGSDTNFLNRLLQALRASLGVVVIKVPILAGGQGVAH